MDPGRVNQQVVGRNVEAKKWFPMIRCPSLSKPWKIMPVPQMKTLFFLEIFWGLFFPFAYVFCICSLCFTYTPYLKTSYMHLLLQMFFVNICGRKHRSSIQDDPRPLSQELASSLDSPLSISWSEQNLAGVDEPPPFFGRAGEQWKKPWVV